MTAPEQAALARNDRFLVEVVEGWSLCPFARATRLAGQLAREVVFGEDATTLAQRAHRHDAGGAQIVLLILPSWTGDARAFERFVDEVRQTYDASKPAAFAMAPFHPDTAFHTDTPARLVGLFRRAPDPTIQLVRYTALDAARRRAPDGKFFFDGSPEAWKEIVARPERGVSEQIAYDNYQTASQRSDELVALLTDIRRAQ
jgi:hypothetical protein